jgi:hypothetical protein
MIWQFSFRAPVYCFIVTDLHPLDIAGNGAWLVLSDVAVNIVTPTPINVISF